MSSLDTDLEPYEIPAIYVSESGYDDMGEILDQLGVQHQPFSNLDPQSQHEAVLMLNCNRRWKGGALGALQSMLDLIEGVASNDSVEASVDQFIRRGNSAIASDFAGEILEEFTRATFDTATDSTTITASVVDQELVDLLGKQQISLEFDMPGWYKPEQTPSGATPILRRKSSGDILAYKFDHGQGQIVYTAFHNHAQASEVEKALLQLLLMIPIAGSTDTSLEDTYTTITGESAVDDGGTVIDDMDGSTVADVTPDPEPTTPTGVKVELDIIDGGTIEKRIEEGDEAQFGRKNFRDHVPKAKRKYVSGSHFTLRNIGNGKIRIRDTDSSNGTNLNGTDISDGEPVPVPDGAELALAGGRATAVVNID